MKSLPVEREFFLFEMHAANDLVTAIKRVQINLYLLLSLIQTFEWPLQTALSPSEHVQVEILDCRDVSDR